MVAVFVMIAGAAQAAARWSASFGAQAVASYLPERDRKPSVMVVAAGSGGEAGAAASALIDALRAGGRVRAAIDGAALGDVEPLSDEQIVKRAASQPVGLIAIVRVFPGSEGHGEMAVVTFYGRDGKAAGAFSVERGAPLQPAASPTEVLGGLGVSAAATGAVSSVLHDDEAAAEPAAPAGQERWNQEFVGFFRDPSKNAFERGREGWGGPYIGSFHVRLSPEGFYDAVDRHDLARWTAQRHDARIALMVTGSVLIATGATLALVGGLSGLVDPFCQQQDLSLHCTEYDRSPNSILLGVGVGVLAAGVVGVIVGKVLRRFPTTMEQSYRLAGDHNRKLRQQLGLPDRGEPVVPPPAPAPESRLLFAPTVAAHGGGLALRVVF